MRGGAAPPAGSPSASNRIKLVDAENPRQPWSSHVWAACARGSPACAAPWVLLACENVIGRPLCSAEGDLLKGGFAEGEFAEGGHRAPTMIYLTGPLPEGAVRLLTRIQGTCRPTEPEGRAAAVPTRDGVLTGVRRRRSAAGAPLRHAATSAHRLLGSSAHAASHSGRTIRPSTHKVHHARGSGRVVDG